MVSPIVFEIKLDRRRTFSLFVNAVGKSDDLVADEVGTYGKHAQHRPVCVSVIRSRRELIDYARQKSFKLTQFLIIGKRSIEKRLVIRIEEISFDRDGTSERIRVLIAVEQSVVEIPQSDLDVAEGEVVASTRADDVSKRFRLAFLDFAAVLELIVQTSLVLQSCGFAVESNVDIKIAHYLAAYVSSAFEFFDFSLFLLEQSAS